MTRGLDSEQLTGEWDISTIEKAAVSVCVLSVDAIAYTTIAIKDAALQTDLSEDWLIELEATIRTKYNPRLEELQNYIASKYAETEHKEKAKYLKDFIEATIVKLGTIPILLRA